MYTVTHVGYGSEEPTPIIYYNDQTATLENIVKEEKKDETTGETIINWYADTTFYTKEEYSAKVDADVILAEDRAVTTSYENTIELIEELRPEV